jgi:hypothetical protein
MHVERHAGGFMPLREVTPVTVRAWVGLAWIVCRHLAFLKVVAKTYPRVKLHVVAE